MNQRKASLSRRQFLKILSTGLGGGVLMGTGLFRWNSLKERSVVRHLRPMMGTLISITAYHAELKAAENAVSEAFAAIEKVDGMMSIHKPNSQLSLINASAGRESRVVDSSLIAILQMAQKVNGWTEGAFDVACLPLMKLYGFYSLAPLGLHYPSDKKIQDLLSRVGQKHIVINEKESRVGLKKEGAAIDLGGIGKGYAVDRAAEALKSFGVEDALVDVGGNILAMGMPHGDSESSDGWRVAIKNPDGGVEDPYFETLTLKNEAVSTSGNYEQSVVLDGRRVGHLFDLRTGKPSNGYSSVTVVAENAALADALSTSAFLLGSNESYRLRSAAKEIYFHGFKG